MPLYRSDIWKKNERSLPASTSTVVSETNKENFLRGEFIIVFDSSTLGAKSLKLSVNNNDDTLTETIYSKLGASIDIEIATQINGSNVELICTNNESHDVTLKMAYLIL